MEGHTVTHVIFDICLALACFATGYMVRRNNPKDPTLPAAKK